MTKPNVAAINRDIMEDLMNCEFVSKEVKQALMWSPNKNKAILTLITSDGVRLLDVTPYKGNIPRGHSYTRPFLEDDFRCTQYHPRNVLTAQQYEAYGVFLAALHGRKMGAQYHPTHNIAEDFGDSLRWDVTLISTEDIENATGECKTAKERLRKLRNTTSSEETKARAVAALSLSGAALVGAAVALTGKWHRRYRSTNYLPDDYVGSCYNSSEDALISLMDEGISPSELLDTAFSTKKVG